ncbi:vWA domain-containing protein [Streptomyces sp. ODS28]|uniref:vWA domain-containing protein n=1 Tax=Streptomyces sp. ODS28 TaxID=3136688 RepID=UPI0031ED6533
MSRRTAGGAYGGTAGGPSSSPYKGPARGRAARRRTARPAAVALLAPLLLAPLFAGAGAAAEEGAGGGAGNGGDQGPDPIDFAIVVDQSASLSTPEGKDRAREDLAREVEAARLIGQGEISDRSRAAVIGFGSAEKNGQSAVNQVCELTVADAVGREQLNDCIGKLAHPDPAKLGPGTDLPAAIGQATDRLTRGAQHAVPKVVFLLTDGRLDVTDSPNYGKSDAAGTRQQNGRKALDEELRQARGKKVQIWPLGFGGDNGIDTRTLRHMAAGGYRNGCPDLPDATPRERVAGASAQLEGALQGIFARARCARFAQGTTGKPGADLRVTIPPVATDGSIIVAKRDPRVHATYYDPEGRRIRDTDGAEHGSRFELSGRNGPVEALRVNNPIPGTWRVRLGPSQGDHAEEASVSAIWQGRLRSVLTMNPSSPRPGERAVVEAWMQTRDNVVIRDPKQLAGIRASARLEGDGFGPVAVRLRDDGAGADKRAGDVHFTGTVTVPGAATGAVSLTSAMAARGVSGDERPYHTRVFKGARSLGAVATVDGYTVHPGGRIKGTLTAKNTSRGTHTLRLALADRRAGQVRISPATVRVPPGEARRIPYTLSFARAVPVGEAGGRIVVTDTTDGGRRVVDTPLSVTVAEPPTWWDAWWWAVVGGALAAAAAAFVIALRRRANKSSRDPSGLSLELRQDQAVVSVLTVRKGQGRRLGFDFTVDAHGTRPALRASRNGASRNGGGRTYRLTREPSGAVRIRFPQGTERSVHANERLSLGDDLELAVLTRGAAGSTASGRGARPGGATSGGGGTGGGTGAGTRGHAGLPRRLPRLHLGRGLGLGLKRSAPGPGDTAEVPGPRTAGEGESAPAAATRHQYDPNF